MNKDQLQKTAKWLIWFVIGAVFLQAYLQNSHDMVINEAREEQENIQTNDQTNTNTKEDTQQSSYGEGTEPNIADESTSTNTTDPRVEKRNGEQNEGNQQSPTEDVATYTISQPSPDYIIYYIPTPTNNLVKEKVADEFPELYINWIETSAQSEEFVKALEACHISEISVDFIVIDTCTTDINEFLPMAEKQNNANAQRNLIRNGGIVTNTIDTLTQIPGPPLTPIEIILAILGPLSFILIAYFILKTTRL